ncbi:hypothetical protein BDZ94DRAFT_1314482 [Collybia nuda]|uniref:DUF6533 domain-containing protein n=1 Tax=Collybia nuda TaxID=64659 RepID=A0A9P6C9G8_9AGAR|nr:hypothetical protein BDZ94DRAFT_1314482 [Collybia nuda]
MPSSTEFIQFDIQYASIALLYYDYALTFGWEIGYIWGQRFRLSTVFYICTRYALIANILFLVSIIDKTSPRYVFSALLYINHPTQRSCDIGYKICSALSILGRASVIIWTARTYAVFNKNKYILAYFLSTGLTCIALDIAHAPSTLTEVKLEFIFSVSTVLAGMMCFFEISVAFCTTLRTIQTRILNNPAQTQKGGMVYLLLEQGIAYFITVTCFTIAAFVLTLCAPGGFLQRLLNAFTLPISCLMTARFLLHLRRWEHKHSNKHGNTMETMQFNQRIVASQSLMSDFGEDPVHRAESDIQIGKPGLGKMRVVGSDSLECDNLRRGSPSMV